MDPMGMEVVFALWSNIFLQVGHGGSWVSALEAIKMHIKHWDEVVFPALLGVISSKFLEFRLEVEKDHGQRHVFIRKKMLR